MDLSVKAKLVEFVDTEKYLHDFYDEEFLNLSQKVFIIVKKVGFVKIKNRVHQKILLES